MEIDTLYNANCIDFMKNMEDKSVDFTLTDIPYGNVNEHVDKDKCQEKAKHLFVGDADVETFDLTDFLPEIKRVTKNSAMIFCGIEQIVPILHFFKESGWSARHMVWVKTNPAPLNKEFMYVSSHENAVWAKRPGAKFHADDYRDWFEFPIGGASSTGMEKIHPTEKNHSMLGKLIADNTDPGDLVFDPCAGSASALLVAGKMGRHYLGCELRKEFFDKAKARLGKVGFQKSLFE